MWFHLSENQSWANVSVVLKVGVVASFEGHRKEGILGAYRDILKKSGIGLHGYIHFVKMEWDVCAFVHFICVDYISIKDWL